LKRLRPRLQSRLEEFLAEVREIAKLVKPVPRPGNRPDSCELFRIGNEPAPTDRPRVTQQRGSVDEQGRWVVEATIRLKSRKTPVRLEPAVYFQVETGAPSRSSGWIWKESNCAADGLVLVVPADKRELKFKGSPTLIHTCARASRASSSMSARSPR
jgi:hypothetical protein